MPWAPGQSGNPEGRRVDKPWRDAIQRAIKRREESDPQALERLADKLLKKVADGDVSAIKELGDRMDGKVPQAIGGTDVLPPIAIEQIVRKIVDTGNPDSAGVQAPPAIDNS